MAEDPMGEVREALVQACYEAGRLENGMPSNLNMWAAGVAVDTVLGYLQQCDDPTDGEFLGTFHMDAQVFRWDTEKLLGKEGAER